MNDNYDECRQCRNNVYRASAFQTLHHALMFAEPHRAEALSAAMRTIHAFVFATDASHPQIKSDGEV